MPRQQRMMCFLLLFFFNACVQRVVNHCFPFPSFSMVLLSLKELLGLYGLCLCCVSFPCELFPASWYWGRLLWVLQEFSAFTEWCWVPAQNGMQACTVSACGTLSSLSSCVRALLSPCGEKHLPLDSGSFFLNVQRSICLPFDFWQLDICAVSFYPQAEKNPASLSSSRALASTCADNLDKEGTSPRHSDILKLTNV